MRTVLVTLASGEVETFQPQHPNEDYQTRHDKDDVLVILKIADVTDVTGAGVAEVVRIYQKHEWQTVRDAAS